MKQFSRGKASPKTSKSKSVWKVRPELSDGLAYVGQQVTKLKLTASSTLLATTITTGVIAYVYSVQAANITGFATRFGSTFDEYRILGVDFRLRQVNNASGVSACFLDEKSASAPTANDATERTLRLISNSNTSSNTSPILRWRARDLLDLQYTAIGTTNVIPVNLKVYTDTANLGAPIAVTSIWLIEPAFYVEFRGLKST